MATRIILQFESDNRTELAALIGHYPNDFEAGMFELERDIEANFMKDIEERIAFLYRFEVRREHLYRPMQEATGVSHGVGLERMRGGGNFP